MRHVDIHRCKMGETKNNILDLCHNVSDRVLARPRAKSVSASGIFKPKVGMNVLNATRMLAGMAMILSWAASASTLAVHPLSGADKTTSVPHGQREEFGPIDNKPVSQIQRTFNCTVTQEPMAHWRRDRPNIERVSRVACRDRNVTLSNTRFHWIFPHFNGHASPFAANTDELELRCQVNRTTGGRYRDISQLTQDADEAFIATHVSQEKFFKNAPRSKEDAPHIFVRKDAYGVEAACDFYYLNVARHTTGEKVDFAGYPLGHDDILSAVKSGYWYTVIRNNSEPAGSNTYEMRDYFNVIPGEPMYEMFVAFFNRPFVVDDMQQPPPLLTTYALEMPSYFAEHHAYWKKHERVKGNAFLQYTPGSSNAQDYAVSFYTSINTAVKAQLTAPMLSSYDTLYIQDPGENLYNWLSLRQAKVKVNDLPGYSRDEYSGMSEIGIILFKAIYDGVQASRAYWEKYIKSNPALVEKGSDPRNRFLQVVITCRKEINCVAYQDLFSHFAQPGQNIPEPFAKATIEKLLEAIDFGPTDSAPRKPVSLNKFLNVFLKVDAENSNLKEAAQRLNFYFEHHRPYLNWLLEHLGTFREQSLARWLAIWASGSVNIDYVPKETADALSRCAKLNMCMSYLIGTLKEELVPDRVKTNAELTFASDILLDEFKPNLYKVINIIAEIAPSNLNQNKPEEDHGQ